MRSCLCSEFGLSLARNPNPCLLLIVTSQLQCYAWNASKLCDTKQPSHKFDMAGSRSTFGLIHPIVHVTCRCLFHRRESSTSSVSCSANQLGPVKNSSSIRYVITQHEESQPTKSTSAASHRRERKQKIRSETPNRRICRYTSKHQSCSWSN